MSTPAQVLANQSNARLSTGPTTEAGKTKVSLNAVKTGLSASPDPGVPQAETRRGPG